MTSTLIPSTELQDLSTVELQSKFFQVSADVELLRQKCGQFFCLERRGDLSGNKQSIGGQVLRLPLL